MFWFYGDLPVAGGGGVEKASAKECCELCSEHEECANWSFGFAAGKFEGKCFLKRSNGYRAKRPGFITGWLVIAAGFEGDEL